MEENNPVRVSKHRPEVPLSLDKVLGLTTFSNSTLSVCPTTGHVAYASGSVAVIYDPLTNKQIRFFRTQKAISAISFNCSGKLLAVGEKGHAPVISLFSTVSISQEPITQFSGHKNGIGCLQFSPSGEYLASVGFRHDKQLILWNMKANKPVALNKLSNKVNSIAFSADSTYFVTCGDRHLKWWYITTQDGKLEMCGKPASILQVLQDAVFTDVICGGEELQHAIYCTTAKGALCVFHETRIMDRWVQLDCKSSYSLSFRSGMLITGCSNGKTHVMDPKTLSHIATLPPPVQLPSEHPDISGSDEDYAIYPACYAVQIISISNSTEPLRIVSVYADRSMFIWELAELSLKNTERLSFIKYASFLYHRACVWDLVFITPVASGGDKPLLAGTFVTCSADNTLRFWNTDPVSQSSTQWKSNHSRDLLHTIHLDVPLGDLPKGTQVVRSSGDSLVYSDLAEGHNPSFQTLSFGLPDTEIPDRPYSSSAPRSLAVHPSCASLAVGDRSGRLRIFQLSSMTQSQIINAHDAEVLTLQYSPLGTTSSMSESSHVLLASAGRDRLVHIFDVTDRGEHTSLSTLDNHSASVTAMTFTSDGTKLVTCGGDKTMVLNSVKGKEITRIKSVQTSSGTINGLAVDATNKFAVTSGQDKRVNIWNVLSGKHVRAYRHEAWGELYKCDIDPSGMFIATCGFDKIIRILDFFSGEVVCEVGGHSELITGIKFSPDGKYLISISGDGCIIQWRLGGLLRAAMKERLLELYVIAKRKQERCDAPIVNNVSNDEPSSSISLNVPVVQEMNVGKVARSRWQARARDQGGYELFGKKIAMSASCDGLIIGNTTNPPPNKKELNKFTIDFTKTDASSPVAKNTSRTTELASTVEALDDVRLGDDNYDIDSSVVADSDIEGEILGKREIDDADAYMDDFEAEDAGDNLQRASMNIENLERSAFALESWLEEKLKAESNLDSVSLSTSLSLPSNRLSNLRIDSSFPPVDSVTELLGQTSEKNLVVKSLTTTFFKTLISKGLENEIGQVSEGGNENGSIPPPVIIEVENFVEGSDTQDLDRSGSEDDDHLVDTYANDHFENRAPTKEENLSSKQVKTAAAMNQMRERLSAMGMINEDNTVVENNESEVEASVAASPKRLIRQELRRRIDARVDGMKKEAEYSSDTESEEALDITSLPPNDDSSLHGYAFPSDKTLMEALHEDVGTPATHTEHMNFPSDETLRTGLEDDSSLTNAGLGAIPFVDCFVDDVRYLAMKNKASECKQIMADLASITQKAMTAFSDLNSLRASVTMLPLSVPPSTVASSSFMPPSPPPFEVDELLCDFRASLTSLTSLVNLASLIEEKTTIQGGVETVRESEPSSSSIIQDKTQNNSASSNFISSMESSLGEGVSTNQAPDDHTLRLLESYSDLMAEMVSAKVMKKLEGVSTSQSMNLTTTLNGANDGGLQ